MQLMHTARTCGPLHLQEQRGGTSGESSAGCASITVITTARGCNTLLACSSQQPRCNRKCGGGDSEGMMRCRCKCPQAL
eukprot:15465793-Alexandrium_andersonii.AAC.2